MKKYGALAFLGLTFATWGLALWAVPLGIGENGLFGNFFETYPFLKISILFILMSHLTITAMSLSFHRAHTHQAVKFNPIVDTIFQTWLWLVTSMSKLDWVSVHIYHHAKSDTELDPHSPVQKGLARVFFFGVMDYSRAKSWPEVLKIRKRLPANRYETFISEHNFLGPILLTASLIFLFGPLYGSVISVLNFAISPFFAIGGVNALAHKIGYRNYESKDNSHNLGFLVFLNWVICGELDHNNHHYYPKSPSFAHRWYEFDIGWAYIRALKVVGLAKITGTVPTKASTQRVIVSEELKVLRQARKNITVLG